MSLQFDWEPMVLDALARLSLDHEARIVEGGVYSTWEYARRPADELYAPALRELAEFAGVGEAKVAINMKGAVREGWATRTLAPNGQTAWIATPTFADMAEFEDCELCEGKGHTVEYDGPRPCWACRRTGRTCLLEIPGVAMWDGRRSKQQRRLKEEAQRSGLAPGGPQRQLP